MLLFWVLSWIGDKFYKTKFYNNNNDTYECGFLTTRNLNTRLNITFFLIGTLLILYDIEFFFLVPFYFNIINATKVGIIIYWIFIIFIVISFVIDWEYYILDWLAL